MSRYIASHFLNFLIIFQNQPCFKKNILCWKLLEKPPLGEKTNFSTVLYVKNATQPQRQN